MLCVCVCGQLGTSIKMHNECDLPPGAFTDKAVRDHHCKYVLSKEQAGKLRRKVSTMLPETELAWRFFVKEGLTPVSTQEICASQGVGTRIDVLARDSCGRLCVLEFKRGCAKNFGNGTYFKGCLQHRLLSSMDLYTLQTLVSHRIFRESRGLQGQPMGIPLLVRVDAATGVHIYKPPAWAIQSLPQVMAALAKQR
jgi:hypothetical protein